MVITGGYGKANTRVTKYSMDGKSQSLPNLITGRYFHACGLFTNANGDQVYCKFSFYHVNIALLPWQGVYRDWWPDKDYGDPGEGWRHRLEVCSPASICTICNWGKRSRIQWAVYSGR